MNYYKVTNVISKIFLIIGLVLFVIFIYTMKVGAAPEEGLLREIINTFSLSEMPYRLLLFCSAVMFILLAVLGINIKKGTGVCGISVVMGAIAAFLKVCDVIEFVIARDVPIYQFGMSVVYLVMFCLYTYCAVKQWD